MVTSRVPVLVSVCRVVASVGLEIPVEGPCVWLSGMLGVKVAVEVCRAMVEAVVEGVVFGMVASVCNSGAELLVVLLNPGDEVAGREGVVAVVVLGLEAVSSVI